MKIEIARKVKKLLKKSIHSFFGLLKRTGFNFDKFISHLNRYLISRGILNERWTIKKAYFDDVNLYSQFVPDRYSINFEKYKKECGFLKFNDLKAWTHCNRRNNAGDMTRFFFLNLCIESLINDGITGDVAELGVYKGNSAALLARYARKSGTSCILFDTFESFDQRDLKGVDAHIKSDVFADTSLNAVKDLAGEKNTIFVKGYFPDSLEKLGCKYLENKLPSYSLVHLDCDLEKPFVSALEHFYPRLVTGGFLIMHDYSSLYWDGAKNAIDAFFKDKPESIIPIPDKSGSCAIRKKK